MSNEAPASLLKSLHAHRFTILLAALVLDILLTPVLVSVAVPDDSALEYVLNLAAFAAMMLTAVLAVSRRWPTTLCALILAAAASAFNVLDHATTSRLVQATSHCLSILFLFFVLCLLIRHVFMQRRVTLNLISAALCAYLILGVMCAAIFALIELYQPGSFHLPEDGIGAFATADLRVDEAARRIYFSFVTLFTLGYGDMFPLRTIARLATVMEAFVGQIMLVVLVARLVGVHVAQSFEAPDKSGSGKSD